MKSAAEWLGQRFLRSVVLECHMEEWVERIQADALEAAAKRLKELAKESDCDACNAFILMCLNELKALIPKPEGA